MAQRVPSGMHWHATWSTLLTGRQGLPAPWTGGCNRRTTTTDTVIALAYPKEFRNASMDPSSG